MPDFNQEEAQKFQSQFIERIREMERDLDRDVIRYYENDPVDNREDFFENLHGLHKYLTIAYRRLGDMLTEIERRQAE